MQLNGTQLSDLIFNLIWNNIFSDDREVIERAMKNRFAGFRSEVEFIKLCRHYNREVLSGGYFLPVRAGQPTLSDPVYFTFDFKAPDHYRDFYMKMAKMNLSKLVYITINNPAEEWATISLFGMEFPSPTFKCFDFYRNEFREIPASAQNLSFLTNLYTTRQPFIQKIKPNPLFKARCQDLIRGFALEDLMGIYLTRLIFDGFIGFGHYRGIPSDIDTIVKDNQGNFRLYEIKEKDLSKTPPVGFGIDVQRFDDCVAISRALELPYYYMVRHVNNQYQRNFIGWKYILFEEFSLQMNTVDLKNGKTEMNTACNDINPTYMLGHEFFHSLKN